MIYSIPMTNDFAAKVLLHYGLQPVRYLGTQKGYRNANYPAVLADGTVINLIVYKREPGSAELVERTNVIAEYTAAKGLPARKLFDRRVICLSPVTQQYAAVYYYLPGTTISWEAYTMRHIKALGMTLSNLHAALQDYSGALPRVHEQYYQLLQDMADYFAQAGVRTAMSAKLHFVIDPIHLQSLQEFIKLTGKLPHQQALHMDFVRGNILYINTDISGILDFEKAAYGHPLYDIARTLAFLLVDCKYKSEEQVRKYLLQSGYQKRGAATLKLLTVNGHDVLERLVDLFLLHDLYKFMRHNPYENLQQNEHYIRTVALCRQRGLVKPVKY